jgi:hypothetical protein
MRKLSLETCRVYSKKETVVLMLIAQRMPGINPLPYITAPNSFYITS